MMKRPRSFISTLLIFFCLATVTLGLTTSPRRAEAIGPSRLADPRAGDPDEPGLALPAPGGELTDPLIHRPDHSEARPTQQVEKGTNVLERLFHWLGIAVSRVQSRPERR
jgi:hypothetical protein